MQIELVPAELNFSEISFRWRQEANMVSFNPLAPASLEQVRLRLANSCSDLGDLKAAQEFIFFVRANGRIAGSLSLKGISSMMGYGEIGYSIGEEFQGQGVGSAAVRAFLEKIFKETELRRLVAFVAEGNAASRKLLERIGFVNEGLMREHYLINGVPTNEVIYGLLRAEWEKRSRL